MHYILEPPEGNLVEFDADSDDAAIALAPSMVELLSLPHSVLWGVQTLPPQKEGDEPRILRRGVWRHGELPEPKIAEGE